LETFGEMNAKERLEIALQDALDEMDGQYTNAEMAANLTDTVWAWLQEETPEDLGFEPSEGYEY